MPVKASSDRAPGGEPKERAGKHRWELEDRQEAAKPVVAQPLKSFFLISKQDDRRGRQGVVT